jgi:hypothetical protein
VGFPRLQNMKKSLCLTQNTHRVVATAAFWRTFHHVGKLAQAGKGGGCTPTPFHYTVFAITYKVVVHSPAERTDTLSLFLLYTPMYFVVLNHALIYAKTFRTGLQMT